jgi:hypothetical protein
MEIVSRDPVAWVSAHLDDLFTNVLGEAVWGLLAVSATPLFIILRISARRMFAGKVWSKFLHETILVLGSSRDDYLDVGGTVGAGDVRALSVITKKLDEINATGYVVKFEDAMTPEDWRRNLVLVGGPRANPATQLILSQLDTGVRFGVGSHGTGLEHIARGRDVLLDAEWSEGGTLISDYGAIILAERPDARGKWVLVVAGGSGLATEFSASRAVNGEFYRQREARKGYALVETFRVGLSSSSRPTIALDMFISNLAKRRHSRRER